MRRREPRPPTDCEGLSCRARSRPRLPPGESRSHLEERRPWPVEPRNCVGAREPTVAFIASARPVDCGMQPKTRPRARNVPESERAPGRSRGSSRERREALTNAIARSPVSWVGRIRRRSGTDMNDGGEGNAPSRSRQRARSVTSAILSCWSPEVCASPGTAPRDPIRPNSARPLWRTADPRRPARAS